MSEIIYFVLISGIHIIDRHRSQSFKFSKQVCADTERFAGDFVTLIDDTVRKFHIFCICEKLLILILKI